MTNICNIDGRIVPEADARIPVMDRGFLFGDSIYEVVRMTDGVPLAWAEHWARLLTSADAIGLQLDLDEATVARRVAATTAAAAHGDSYVRIVVTRGSGEAPNIDVAYATGSPCWVLIVRPLTLASGKPVRLALVDRLRNDRRALSPATKSGNYLNNVLALAEAQARGASDCVMLNVDGHVTEASTSNLFARVGEVWCTPRLEDGILAGVTRGMLIDFLPLAGERVEQRALSVTDLKQADEIFLSSTLRDIAPVTHLDGRELSGSGQATSMARLIPAFQQYLAKRLRERDGPHWSSLLG